jgi:hypothetical protein
VRCDPLYFLFAADNSRRGALPMSLGLSHSEKKPNARVGRHFGGRTV